MTTDARRGTWTASTIAAAVASLTSATPALAASQAPAATVALSDLIEIDTLGYTCIAEASLESAFGATGKSGRLPRTCLPEPCDGALSRDELASLIGRTPSGDEWDDYFARYAQVCRHEALGFGAPDVPAVVDADGFWAPFLAPRLASATLPGDSAVLASAPLPFVPVLSSGGSGGSSDDDDGADDTVTQVPGGRTGGEGEEDPILPPLADGGGSDDVIVATLADGDSGDGAIPAVPLPGGLALMGGALAALGTAAFRRTRRPA